MQTNNATYGRTGQPDQQLAMSRLRAVEHGRAVVIAATSGISAIIGPDGTIDSAAGSSPSRSLSADRSRCATALTVADRVGAAPEWTLAMVGLLSCAVAIALGRRRTAPAHARQEKEQQ